VRVVIDTNVLVSGVLNPHGTPGRIVESMLTRRFVVLHDDRILSEYRDVLLRPVFRFEPADVDAILDHLELSGERVSCEPSGVILPDVSDLAFLEVAMSGFADVLITGNAKHFIPKHGRHHVIVSSPADFLRLLT
jgi:putative PIN family toxin of toxin-antitoxin system